MNNTSLIFIALHSDQNEKTIEYYIDINKIVTIAPHNNGGTIIYTVSCDDFCCKESINEVMKLIGDAFANAIKERNKYDKSILV